jgi:hypothetical protein
MFKSPKDRLKLQEKSLSLEKIYGKRQYDKQNDLN